MSVKSYYDTYWRARSAHGSGSPSEPLGRLLAGEIGSSPTVLDAGCGSGQPVGVWLDQRVAGYVGVDVAETAIEAATGAGLDARLIEDAGELPFDDRSFDAAVCLEVLEHLFAPYDAASEILRVLKPGGKLVVTVPNIAYWRLRCDMAVLGRWNPLGDFRSTQEPWRDPHIRFFTARTLDAMLRDVGFEVATIGGHGGTLLGEIPGLRRVCVRHGGRQHPEWRSNPVYRRLERALPGLLGYRLHAVAIKPGS